jgi:hypothetical protein
LLEHFSQAARLHADEGIALRVEVGTLAERRNRNRVALETVSTTLQRFLDDEFEELSGLNAFQKFIVSQDPGERRLDLRTIAFRVFPNMIHF